MQPKTQPKLTSLWRNHVIMVFFFLFTINGFSQSNNCAAAPTLTVGTTCTTTNYNVERTFTNSGVALPAACSTGTSHRDGWYTFTTDATTTSITIEGTSNRRLGLALYSGVCGGLTPITCSIPNAPDASLNSIAVSPSTTYRLRLMRTNNDNNNDMTGTICVYKITAPSTNFTCATATSLPCGTTNLAGTTVGSPGTPAHGSGCTMSNYGAWYTFVGDGQQTTITSVAGSGFDHEMAISSGSCGSLTSVACRDSGLSGGTESHTFISTSGVTYYVYIAYFGSSGTSTDTGTFDISRTCTPIVSPSNDDCSGATALTVNPDLSCGTTTAGTIAWATDSGVTGSGCSGTDDDDVWYSFVATSTAHQISLLNVSGSVTDMYHSVYNGSCGSLGSAIVCSDNNTSTIGGLTIGNTYYVQVYTYTSTGGQNTTFDVCVGTPPPPPANDECSGAVSLTVNPDLSCGTTTAGSVASATDSGVTGSGCGGTDDDDVWFSFVATNTAHHVDLINVSGSTTDLYHAVYDGSSGCGSLGAAISCSDPDSSTLTGLTPGNTYYVQVYSWTSTAGQTTTFDVCIGTPCNGTGPGTGTTTLGCPSVVSGGLGLNGADPAPINCTAMSTCVDLEATYLDLGDTSTYTVTSIPYSPPYQFNCLANPVSVNDDDVWSPAITLPFDFCFFGISYNQCTIGSNGVLSFDIANAGTYSGYSFSNDLPSTTGALFANSIYGVYHMILTQEKGAKLAGS